MVQVPVIDLTVARVGGRMDREHVARQIDTACQQIGFLAITGAVTRSARARRRRPGASARGGPVRCWGSEGLVRIDDRPPHVRHGRVVAAQTLLRLLEMAADDVEERFH